MTLLWLKGLVKRRPVRLLGTVTGIALTVALLTSLAAFIVSSSASMTRRAVATVPVDWQVQLTPDTAPKTVLAALRQATPVKTTAQVCYAQTAGLEAQTGSAAQATVQTTGPGKVLGLPQDYFAKFPGQVRSLVGSLQGALVAQQTAANLHVTVGDRVKIMRVGLPPVQVKVAGVVELPNADSMFQAVGVPSGSAPQAPPDNVVLLPAAQWHTLFDPQAAVRPDSVRTQLHVRIGHNGLPNDPSAAYLDVSGGAKNLEAHIAGSGSVADNLAARLDGARGDALYARVLFLFLGTPGALLAALLTLAVTASGQTRRRQEQALLRTRGASSPQLLRLAGFEALGVGVAGIIFGFLLAFATSWALLGTTLWTTVGVGVWLIASALVGFLLAAAAVMLPAWRALHGETVASTKAVVGHADTPLWERLYLDVLCLALAAVVFWQTAKSGYQVVLAPEGVAQTSVNYTAFVAPVFLWLGAGLLTLRLWNLLLGRGAPLLAGLFRPVARGLSGTVAASLGRQRRRIAGGVVLVALAFSFAASTAVFNTTYNGQSRVDALLTNGADVTVTGTTAAPAGTKLAAFAALPGVQAAAPMQHRFAYVGNDLQDLYGVNPNHIGEATVMSNAYFGGGDAQATLGALSTHPDGVLVSEETVRDFQLQVGDRINLRLQSAKDNRYHAVPFTFVGVAREFPTAPKDSFLVANAGYIAQQTGTGAAETVLLKTSDAAGVVKAAEPLVRSLPGAKVSSLGQAQSLISSSLTAVDLRGLTRLELTFAFILLAAASGLVLALGLAERRRTFAILSALGAKSAQLGAFLWSEGLFVLVSGAVVGLLTGFGVAEMLVKVLTGVFDPPPEALSVPWEYLSGLIIAAAVATVLAIFSARMTARRPVVQALRDL